MSDSPEVGCKFVHQCCQLYEMAAPYTAKAICNKTQEQATSHKCDRHIDWMLHNNRWKTNAYKNTNVKGNRQSIQKYIFQCEKAVGCSDVVNYKGIAIQCQSHEHIIPTKCQNHINWMLKNDNWKKSKYQHEITHLEGNAKSIQKYVHKCERNNICPDVTNYKGKTIVCISNVNEALIPKKCKQHINWMLKSDHWKNSKYQHETTNLEGNAKSIQKYLYKCEKNNGCPDVPNYTGKAITCPDQQVSLIPGRKPLTSVQEHAHDEVNLVDLNMFWWNQWRNKHGATFIKNFGKSKYKDFDIFACQECENMLSAFSKIGLGGKFAELRSRTSAINIGYKKSRFTKLHEGNMRVGEDNSYDHCQARGNCVKGKNKYYGYRYVLWTRLKEKNTGKTYFILNHHGVLNEGLKHNQCHGKSKCDCNSKDNLCTVNIGKKMKKLIETNAVVGKDNIVITGDFNGVLGQGPYAQIFKELDTIPNLTHKQIGNSFGGVDHLYRTNAKKEPIILSKFLTGSDHQGTFASI
eukprot:Pgem_evm1s18300